MSDDADFEEGEVDDLSDFEDGNIGDTGTISPSGDGSGEGSPSNRGAVRGDWRVAHKNRQAVGESLLQFLSDDERTHARKISGPKRKRKKREWCSNNVDRTPPTRRERIRCRFFSEGRCNKGSDCPFSHGIMPTKKPELCKFYATGTCNKGPACPFLHGEFPCKFFHLSMNCYHGSNCKFSHKPLTPSTRSLLDKLTDEQTRNSHPLENASFNREVLSGYPHPIQFPQGALTEPYGDVDYRRMNHSGSSGMGAQPCVPCGFQLSPQPVGRRPPPLESHPQHFRRPVDECRPRPPPGYCGPPPFRGPFPPPYRFHPGKSYPPLHRPPLGGGNRETPMAYAPPRFRPPYHDSGGENFLNSPSTAADDHPLEQPKITDLKEQKTEPTSPSPHHSPINDQREIPPKMTVSRDIVVYLNEKTSTEATPVAFRWHIVPLEIDINSRQLPPSVANANPVDPRLKARPQLPVLLSIPSISTEEKQSDAKNPPQPERRKRPKLTLNEMANTFARTGYRVQSKTPVLYSNILDPRLLKRQKVEDDATPSGAAAEEEQSLTPKALRVVFSP